MANVCLAPNKVSLHDGAQNLQLGAQKHVALANQTMPILQELRLALMNHVGIQGGGGPSLGGQLLSAGFTIGATFVAGPAAGAAVGMATAACDAGSFFHAAERPQQTSYFETCSTDVMGGVWDGGGHAVTGRALGAYNAYKYAIENGQAETLLAKVNETIQETQLITDTAIGKGLVHANAGMVGKPSELKPNDGYNRANNFPQPQYA
jgi:hypothetical protein